ncbi:MAG: redoxin domain-containing protein [Oligoflexia bacterium]|nr:redoxin domain-containing protein [Oligoflexia bacterium]
MRKLIASLCLVGLVAVWGAGSWADSGDPLAPGATAPAFELSDEAGTIHRLADLKGKVVVLEWTNPDCPFVRRHYKSGTMKNLAQKYQAQGVVWLAINSTRNASSQSNAEWKNAQGFIYPILDDHGGEVGKAYRAKTTPHMFIIGTDGNIAYNGAIDSDPSGEEQHPSNYVDSALSELLQKHPITTALTKSYGCSVKYAS